MRWNGEVSVLRVPASLPAESVGPCRRLSENGGPNLFKFGLVFVGCGGVQPQVRFPRCRAMSDALLHTFPYAVYFRASDEIVTVLAVLHLRSRCHTAVYSSGDRKRTVCPSG
jgi:hypothetical protein